MSKLPYNKSCVFVHWNAFCVGNFLGSMELFSALVCRTCGGPMVALIQILCEEISLQYMISHMYRRKRNKLIRNWSCTF